MSDLLSHPLLTCPLPSIKPTPYKTNLDFYRGRTKSVYETETMFRDFARSIPLSQSNLYDNTNLSGLKRDFQSLLVERHPVPQVCRPDPLSPSVRDFSPREPMSEVLARKHRVQSAGPVVLPYIYVYHR